MSRLQQLATSFIEDTRDYIFVRPEDNLIILRPNRVHYLNRTATAMLHALYQRQPVDVAALVAEWSARWGVPAERIEADLDRLLHSLSLLLQDKTGCAPAVRHTPFGSHQRQLPILSEIALTYRCQNRCRFCYASSPDRGRPVPEMSTAQVKRGLDILVEQARVPAASLPGGDHPTPPGPPPTRAPPPSGSVSPASPPGCSIARPSPPLAIS